MKAKRVPNVFDVLLATAYNREFIHKAKPVRVAAEALACINRKALARAKGPEEMIDVLVGAMKKAEKRCAWLWPIGYGK